MELGLSVRIGNPLPTNPRSLGYPAPLAEARSTTAARSGADIPPHVFEEGLRIDALRPLGPLNLELAAEKPSP
jgi:hypothetical protein